MWRRCLWPSRRSEADPLANPCRWPFLRQLRRARLQQCALPEARTVSNDPNLSPVPFGGCCSPPCLHRIHRAMHDVPHRSAPPGRGSACHANTVSGERREFYLAREVRCPFGHSLQVKCGPSLPRPMALQWCEHPPDAVTIFSPNRIKPCVKAHALHAVDIARSSDRYIDRLDQSRLGQIRSHICDTGDLPCGTPAESVLPASSAWQFWPNNLEVHSQIFLNTATILCSGFPQIVPSYAMVSLSVEAIFAVQEQVSRARWIGHLRIDKFSNTVGAPSLRWPSGNAGVAPACLKTRGNFGEKSVHRLRVIRRLATRLRVWLESSRAIVMSFRPRAAPWLWPRWLRSAR